MLKEGKIFKKIKIKNKPIVSVGNAIWRRNETDDKSEPTGTCPFN